MVISLSLDLSIIICICSSIESYKVQIRLQNINLITSLKFHLTNSFCFFFRSDLTRHTYSRHGATRRSEIVSITVNLIFKRLKNLNFKRQVLDKILRFEVQLRSNMFCIFEKRADRIYLVFSTTESFLKDAYIEIWSCDYSKFNGDFSLKKFFIVAKQNLL